MPFETAAALDQVIESQNKAIAALQEGRAVDRAEFQTTLAAISQAAAAKRLERANNPDSDIAQCLVNRDEMDMLRDQAQGRTYLPGEGTKDAAVVLRSCKTHDGDWLPGLLDAPEIRTPWVHELRDLVTTHSLLWRVDAGRDRGFARHARRAGRALKRHLQNAPDELRGAFNANVVERIFANSSTIGAEMIFQMDVPMIAERMELEASISALFPQEMVNSASFKIPTSTRGLTPYKKGVNVTDDPAKFRKSSIVTGSRTYDLVGIAVATQYDEDAADDVTWMAMGQRLQIEGARALVWGREGAILHGDALQAAHQDTIAAWNPRSLWDSTQLGGADDHRRLWTGLRAHAKDVSGASGDQDAAANAAVAIRAARAALTAPIGLQDLVCLVSYEYFMNDLVSLEDFKKLDSYGQLASRISSNITGPLPNQVGVIDGIPVCIAWQLTDDLETSGLYTDGSGAKTGFLLVPRSKWKLFVRRAARVETEKDITRGVYDVVLTARELFALDASVPTTDKSVYYAFNL